MWAVCLGGVSGRIALDGQVRRGEHRGAPWMSRRLRDDEGVAERTCDAAHPCRVCACCVHRRTGFHQRIVPVNTHLPGAVVVNLDEVQATLSGASAAEETPISLRIQPMEPAVEHPIRLTLLDSKAPDSTA